MPLQELARAKINLTLSVLGRRSDGYHDLESLVAFAGIGDRVTLQPGPDASVTTSGPFAAAIDGPNLLERALELLRALGPGLQLGAVALEKILPVAAGLGGGSADAAALLRAVRRANPERSELIDWHGLAARLGADVPACLAGVPALMRGIGDLLEPLTHPLPPLPAVLVNPRVPLSTAHVFRALAASPPSPRFSRGEGRGEGPPLAQAPEASDLFPDFEALLAYMRAHGNDLEPPAIALLPVIADLKAALAAEPGCILTAISGSGPTCFGLFADDATAANAASSLASSRPTWWTTATRLG
jgi:4-diphosphocytidyl-2-C-methyl-D-erythritol kinase